MLEQVASARRGAAWAAALIAVLCACGDDDSSVYDGGAARARDAGARGRDAEVNRPSAEPDLQDDETDPHTDAGSLPADASAGGAAANAGTAGTGSLDAGAQPPSGSPASPPTSEYCGDAIRDPRLEECDDGPGEEDDACSDACIVRSTPLLPFTVAEPDAGPAAELERSFGTGPHVAAAGAQGFAVVYVERGQTPAVMLQAHDEHGGRRAQPIAISAGGEAPLGSAHPVIAALPDDRYAVAWTDAAAATPDVRVRLWNASSGELGSARTAHDNLGGFQQDADLLWTGEQLIVAYTDLLDVRYRAFSAELRPLGPARALAASPTAIESSVSLARFAGGWAAALRANEDALERIEVVAGSLSWSTPLAPPGPSGDRPALVALDDEHLLLLFTIGSDPLGSGQANVGRLQLAVLSVNAPGAVSASAFGPLRAPYADDLTLEQRRPSVVRVGARTYVAWQSASPGGDVRGAQTLVAELRYDPASAILVQHEERSLALDAAGEGAQHGPRVAASPLFPEGALITVWEDAWPVAAGAGTQLALDFRPAPFVSGGLALER